MTDELIDDFKYVLRQNIDGEVFTNSAQRKLFSTDASIYQIEPLGVVFPRTEDDLAISVEVASSFGLPVLPRGSGSSLAGQTVGAAIVIDCSRYLHKVLDIDPDARAAVVQPGVVLDDLNRLAGASGLKFGPDPASSDRATFGGMIGNNSTGAHSIKFGMTADHVLEIDVVLSDGSQTSFSEITLQQAQDRSQKDTRSGAIYKAALEIRERDRGEIMEHWPLTWRRASGYSLNYLLPWADHAPPQWEGQDYPPVSVGRINLAPLVVGSEGTLVVVKRAKIGLVPTPSHSVLAVLNYDSIDDACDDVERILETQPSAVELVPRALIKRARAVPAYAELLWFTEDDPAALLVVEFSGESKQQIEAKAKALDRRAVLALSAEQQDSIWRVRKVGLGLLMSRPGDAKPLPFIEDVAVPVEHLGEFVREFERIVASFGTKGDFYAHASAGCLHVRPIIDLKSAAGQKALRGITKAVVELTVRLGGALSGEHGDGLARSEWLEEVYGRKIVSAFAQLKNAADPQSVLNPGKIVSPPPMDESLRYSPDYRAKGWDNELDFSDQDGLVGAIEMCNGAGVCRKVDGVMCPSFQVSHDEMHSTRGRANLLRAMISSPANLKGQNEFDAFAALDLCVECKGCKAECPSAVDMAKLKVEFLNNFYQDHRRPLRDYLFAYLPSAARWGAYFAPFASFMLDQKWFRSFVGNILGISPLRKWPVLHRPQLRQPQPDDASDGREQVILLLDVFSHYIEPQLAVSAVQLLEAAGCRVHLLDVGGSGRTLISKGFLNGARRQASKVLAAVNDIDPFGRMPVVGIEPSEIYTLRDEYLSFFPDDQAVLSVARRSFMLDEFLIRPGRNGTSRIEELVENHSVDKEFTGRVFLHGHCYQKTQPPSHDDYAVGEAASAQLLAAAGIQVEHIESGCCGMAGSFGFEAEHHDFSLQIGELCLFPAVRKMASNELVAAPGASCRSQIVVGAQREAVHPLELLAEALSLR